MPLWGATDSDESKPKNLTTAQKKQVFANASGWVLEAGSALSGNDNTSAQPEVLVAIGGLAESLGAADITEIEFITTAFDKSDGGTLQVRARLTNQLMLIHQVVHQHLLWSMIQMLTTHCHTPQEQVLTN